MKKIIAIVLCSVALTAIAQQSPLPQQAPAQKAPPSPEEVKKMMEMSMGAMVPVMAKMADGMIEVMLQRGEDPATARRMARFKKNLYDALVKEGFTIEQALAIMESTAIPTAAPAMK